MKDSHHRKSWAWMLAGLVIVVSGVSLLLCCRPGSQQGADCLHDEYSLRCVRYLRNYDADTITFEIAGVHPLLGREIPIRVLGVDTPEMKGKSPCEKDRARKAQSFVADKLRQARRIDLKNISRDKYFRIDAEVEIDGKPLSRMLLDAQLAVSYDGGTKQDTDWCKVP